ncbi:MFS transporter [Alicyclobacillus sp. ALC3]|uniref:MFS transporter n=1 Tax=Alicyclobacillus sp. ALC3 TaxID=2796143 RepID=UPI002377EBB3|nr:MFS transporter [Alicyclobacillus sp. ALC3]WDL98740.1 MFS transporter [Alicyclobacillus sp. ALC3]
MTLWKHRDFLKLWSGQTVSEIGSRITREGLPMLAVLSMGVTPLSMSGLSLATKLPAAAFGLFIGVIVDRFARRPLMLAADVLRACLLLLVPVLALTGHLHLWVLYAVAGCSSILSLLFDVSYQAYVPWLIGRDRLVEGNTKLSVTASFAEAVGPGLTGLLVQALTAPIAVGIDALSYLFSASSLISVRGREHRPERHVHALQQPLRQEFVEGLRVIGNNRVLFALTGAMATYGFASSAIFVLDTLYALRTLGLSPFWFGVTVTMGGFGSLLGAAVAGRTAKRFGLGRTMVVSLFVQASAGGFWLLAGGPIWRSVACLFAAQLIGDTAGTMYEIFDTTLRQTLTSDHLLGRVNATMRGLDIGMTALGTLGAGLVGQAIGIRSTMGLAVAGMLLSGLWVLYSPVRRLVKMPQATG